MTVTAYQMDEIRSDRKRRYMETTASLVGEFLVCRTRTWTTQPWWGFTGGVRVLGINAENHVVDYTRQHQFGVDGFRIPFKVSDRRDVWYDHLSNPGDQIVTLHIWHYHAPKNRLEAILRDAKEAAKDIADVAAEVGIIVGAVA
jgi:hypothetical protein